MKKSAEVRDVGLFVLCCFLYSWPIFFVVDAWLVPMFWQQDKRDIARVILAFGHMLAMLGPAFASWLMWRVFHRGSQPAWKWSQPKYYILVVLAMLGFWGLPALVNVGLGDTLESPITWGMWTMIGAFLFGGWFSGMGEEIGWCGYFLPRLAPKTGKARALIVSGAVRGLWHWPVVISPVLVQFIRGEQTLPILLVAALAFAVQLVLSNIFFGAVFAWIWYRTESMPLVGWLHYWYDFVRDVTALLLVGYGSSLWSTHLSSIVFIVVGYELLEKIAKEEGTTWKILYKLPTASPAQP